MSIMCSNIHFYLQIKHIYKIGSLKGLSMPPNLSWPACFFPPNPPPICTIWILIRWCYFTKATWLPPWQCPFMFHLYYNLHFVYKHDTSMLLKYKVKQFKNAYFNCIFGTVSTGVFHKSILSWIPSHCKHKANNT